MWSMTFLACHPAVTRITFGKKKVSVVSLLRGLMMPKSLTKPTRKLIFLLFQESYWIVLSQQGRGLKTGGGFTIQLPKFLFF